MNDPNDKFSNDLHDLYDGQLEIPHHMDDQILAGARHPLRLRRRWRMALRVGGAAAAAAVVAIGVRVATHPPVAPMVYAQQDINHDGKVDILDAFALARDLKAPAQVDAKLDFTGDGKVDQQDVDAVATSAVSLKQGVTR